MKISGRGLILVFSVLLLGGPVLASSGITVVLKERVQIPHSVVTLGDLARIEGHDAERLSALRLMRTPVSPAGSSVSAAWIRERIARQVSLPLQVRGASEVLVAPLYTEIVREQLETIFTHALMREQPYAGRGRIVIEDIRAPLSVRVWGNERQGPQAKISPREDFLGPVSMILSFGEGPSSTRVRISARVSLETQVPVARAPIRRGEMITEAALVMRPMKVCDLESLMTDKASCTGMRAKTAIRAEAPILQANVEPRPVVCRGETVIIEASRDRLVVRDKGVALRDGGLSQRIPVRNVTSGKQVFGTIIAPSCVRVVF